MLYIGTRSAGETSPCALRHIVGPPTYTVSTLEHGNPRDADVVRAKNFDIYLRNLPPVPPSHLVPVSLQRPRASHPDPTVQMKLRSSFPPAFAKAHVRVWDSPDLPPHAHHEADRPAAVVDDGYAVHRVQMLCSYWAFASQYAPQVSAVCLASLDRGPLLVAVPMGYTGSCVAALTPRDGGCFAMDLMDSVPLLQQMQAFKDFLPCDVEPQQMGRTRTSRVDVIFAMPYVGRVEGALTDAAEWPLVPAAHSAAWCCSGALSSDQVLLVSIAFERARSFVQAGPWLSGTVGVYHGPKPVYSARSAERFRSGHDDDHAAAEWQDFLVLEKDRRHLFIDASERADAGTGLLAPFLDNVITAWDVRDELTPPPQGLPHIHVDVLLLLPYPEPPAPLHTSYLARMPPQSKPDGFPTSFAWDEVCRRWSRRIFADALNSTFAHDAQCVREGWSDLPRHPFICLGPEVFKHFHFQDGGKIRLNQFILVQHDDGRLYLLDFTQWTGDHKSLLHLLAMMGFTSDRGSYFPSSSTGCGGKLKLRGTSASATISSLSSREPRVLEKPQSS